MNLTDFLLTRIAEDERAAGKLAETDARPVLALAITVNHPRRLLLECEAKRRIVEELREVIDYDQDRFIVSPQVELVATRTISYLALPYADHPDYDESWRP